jgi:Effector protein
VPAIKYDGSDEYNQKVDSIVQQIAKNDVGAVIVRQITARGQELSFVPRDQRRVAANGVCNAETGAQNWPDSAPAGVSAKGPGYWYRGEPDNPRTPLPDDERYSLMPFGATGTGNGSDVTIHFDPDAYFRSKCDQEGPGSASDEVLLHEMVHALREMQGQRNPIPTENAGYDNDEEFLAVVVTNVYMSSKGASLLRADHASYRPLKPPLTTSQGFLADPDNLKLMKIYNLIWESTFADLALLGSQQFNPFREFSKSLAYTVPRPFF